MANRKDANRKKNAQRQRELRADRDAKGQCRTCGDPAVVSERTGRLAKQCAVHLGCDVRRKDVYVLPWETTTPLRQAIELRLEFPLGPLL